MQDLGEKRGLSDLALLCWRLRAEEIMSSHIQDEAAAYPKDMRLSQDLDFRKKIRRLKNMIEDLEIKTRLPGGF
ncbi:hypothetical protein [Gluconobacter thailandicus]|uniref:Uncharacterized protein n=1 Tax=Gluconobacter thailandicus TaxID=257438 RepID=A0AAP9ET54_GLUTH|nr:hypothetical protein [Gluconobacter thailandicus]QEH97341.1 hypothetical protein FXF46_14575 [Gluconobacter thailandicus]